MTFRESTGLVLIALKRFDKDRSPVVLTQIRDGGEDPPYSATYWKTTGGKWNHDFGGRWSDRGDGRMEWQWN